MHHINYVLSIQSYKIFFSSRFSKLHKNVHIFYLSMLSKFFTLNWTHKINFWKIKLLQQYEITVPRRNYPWLLCRMQRSKLSCFSSNSNHWRCTVVKEAPFWGNYWKYFYVLESTWLRDEPCRRKRRPGRRVRRVIGEWKTVSFCSGKRKDIYETKR